MHGGPESDRQADPVGVWVVPVGRPPGHDDSALTLAADWVPWRGGGTSPDAGSQVRESLAWMDELEARARALEERLRRLSDDHRI